MNFNSLNNQHLVQSASFKYGLAGFPSYPPSSLASCLVPPQCPTRFFRPNTSPPAQKRCLSDASQQDANRAQVGDGQNERNKGQTKKRQRRRDNAQYNVRCPSAASQSTTCSHSPTLVSYSLTPHSIHPLEHTTCIFYIDMTQVAASCCLRKRGKGACAHSPAALPGW
jgi:hypothetical protein